MHKEITDRKLQEAFGIYNVKGIFLQPRHTKCQSSLSALFLKISFAKHEVLNYLYLQPLIALLKSRNAISI